MPSSTASCAAAPILAALVGAVAFAVVATLTVFSSPLVAGAADSRRGGATLAALTGAGGGTEAFAVGASFAGFLVFVTFIALVGDRVLGRHVPGAAAPRPAPAAGDRRASSPGSWSSPPGSSRSPRSLTFGIVARDGSGEGHLDESSGSRWPASATPAATTLTVLAGVAGWAVFGTTLAVIFRSAPLALGVGFAWAGPFENIVVDSWNTGYRVFPGQVLGSLIRGGTTELAMGRAVATALVYTGIAAVACLALVVRRDVTS